MTLAKRKPNYIDRTSPEFGDGKVMFAIRSYADGSIVRIREESVVVKTLAYVEADPGSAAAIEETRKQYYSEHGRR